MESLPAGIGWALLGVLLVLSALFSGSEVALLGPPRSWVQRIVPPWFRTFLAYPDGLLLAILVGNNLVNSYAAILFDALARDWFPPRWSESLVVVLFGLLVFAVSELPPKLLAYIHPQWLARPGSVVLAPLVAVLSLPFRILGIRDPENEPSINEVLALLDAQEKEGETSETLTTLKSFLSFLNMTVDDVMTPWSKVRWITPEDDVLEAFRKYPHHTLPVYDPQRGVVVGLATLKGHLCGSRKQLPARAILDTTPLASAFDRFRRERLPMLVVVDEYGNLRGVVTQRDIIRPFLQPVRSPMIRPLGENAWLVDAGVLVDELYKETGIELPGSRLDTLAAWLLDHLARIPEEGEVVEVDGVEIEVLKRRSAAVEQLKIIRRETS